MPEPSRVKALLERLAVADGIYGQAGPGPGQEDELRLRQGVAARRFDDYLAEVARYHSVPVMDREVDRFLRGVPPGGVIVDVGGCWGWHWRRLPHTRPDVTVCLVDFVRDNLGHARRLLGEVVDRQVFLVHGDGTRLAFPDGAFDAYWSVQTLQHIPDYRQAVREARRVLVAGGWFANYSLNVQGLARVCCKLLGRSYHVAGQVPQSFYLARATGWHRQVLAEAFGSPVSVRYSEVLFQPEFHFGYRNWPPSWLGRVDGWLSGPGPLWRLVARQVSHHCRAGSPPATAEAR